MAHKCRLPSPPRPVAAPPRRACTRRQQRPPNLARTPSCGCKNEARGHCDERRRRRRARADCREGAAEETPLLASPKGENSAVDLITVPGYIGGGTYERSSQKCHFIELEMFVAEAKLLRSGADPGRGWSFLSNQRMRLIWLRKRRIFVRRDEGCKFL